MTNRWVGDQLVPMTAEEQADFDAVQAAAATQVQQQQVLDGNAATMTDRVNTAIANLENAAQNWGTLTQAQKDQTLLLTVRVVARLARLMLRRLDTAT